MGAEEWMHLTRQTPAAHIDYLLQMPGGEVWVATDNNFFQYDGTVWRIIDGAREQFNFPVPFISDDAGKVYFLDGKKLGVLSGSAVQWFDSAGAQAPVTGAFGDDGVLYFTSNNLSWKGIYSFDGDAVTRISDERAISVAADHDGRVWATVRDSATDEVKLVCREQGAVEWIDRTAEISAALAPLIYSNIPSLRIAPDGALWVNNRGKYAVYRDDGWTFGGSGGTPLYIDFDSSGDVWGCGTTAIYLLNESDVWESSHTMTIGPNLMPRFMAETVVDGVLIADNDHLYHRINGYWKPVESPYDLASDKVTTMAFTYDGTLLCGHAIRKVQPYENLGISIWDGTQWYNTNLFGRQTVNNVFHLETTPDGGVMAYTDFGFFEYLDNTWTKIDSLDAVVEADIVETDMTWEDYNTLWLTTYKGLVRYNPLIKPNRVVYLPRDPDGQPYPGELFSGIFGPDGLLYCQDLGKDILSFEENNKIWELVIPNNQAIQTNDFTFDSEGLIWGALDTGLFWWDESSRDWIQAAPIQGARKVDIDGDGRIWVANDGGTGYYSNDSWHTVPEFEGVRISDFAFSELGDVAVNAYDYTRDTYRGLYVNMMSTGLNDAPPEAVSIETISVPNPFNPVTAIRFRLPEAGYADIAVYSTSGQKIRSFGQEWYPAGWNSVVWDSRSDSGEQCASGVYFYHISAGAAVAAGKMLLLR